MYTQAQAHTLTGTSVVLSLDHIVQHYLANYGNDKFVSMDTHGWNDFTVTYARFDSFLIRQTNNMNVGGD